MQIRRNRHGNPLGIRASKHGVHEFLGIVTRRSKTGLWAQILLEEPFEGQPEIRLWGIDYNYILPSFIEDGVRVKFRANVNPGIGVGCFQNKFINFRLVWDVDNAVNGKKFRKLSIEPVE